MLATWEYTQRASHGHPKYSLMRPSTFDSGEKVNAYINYLPSTNEQQHIWRLFIIILDNFGIHKSCMMHDFLNAREAMQKAKLWIADSQTWLAD